MIWRKEFPATCKVFYTDIFCYRKNAWSARFLGNRVRAAPVHKLCAMEVDEIEGFEMIEALTETQTPLTRAYRMSDWGSDLLSRGPLAQANVLTETQD